MENCVYAYVGEQHNIDDPPYAYILDIDTHVRELNVNKLSFIESVRIIQPQEYFVTSGDAVRKCKQMFMDAEMWLSKAGNAYTRKRCTSHLARVIKLLDLLKECRGTHSFLETEWNHHRQLLCIPKNPRDKKNKELEIMRAQKIKMKKIKA